MNLSKNNFKGLCYKSKALYHLGKYRECLVYAKSAISIQPNQVMMNLIKESDSKLEDTYKSMGLREKINEIHEEEIISISDKSDKIVINQKKKKTFLAKLIKVIYLSILEMIGRNKLTLSMIFAFLYLLLKSNIYNSIKSIRIF